MAKHFLSFFMILLALAAFMGINYIVTSLSLVFFVLLLPTYVEVSNRRKT